MAILTKGQTFATADSVTSTKLNNLVDAAAFVTGASGSTDDTSLEVNGSGRLQIKDLGVASAKLAASAVTTSKLASSTLPTDGVTYAKLQRVANMKAIGNVSGVLAVASEVSILDEDDMVSDSATSLATQQSIKAYVGTQTDGLNTITVGTAVASTSGTDIDFTSLPAGIKRITILLDSVSSNGTGDMSVRLGDATSFEATGYSGYVSFDAGRSIFTTAFVMTIGISASSLVSGIMTIARISGNQWVATANTYEAPYTFGMAGRKTLTGELTRVRIRTSSGDTFDAGTINIFYE